MEKSKADQLLQTMKNELEMQRQFADKYYQNDTQRNFSRFLDAMFGFYSQLQHNRNPYFYHPQIFPMGLGFRGRGFELSYKPIEEISYEVPINIGDKTFYYGQIILDLVERPKFSNKKITIIDFIHPNPSDNWLVAYSSDYISKRRDSINANTIFSALTPSDLIR